MLHLIIITIVFCLAAYLANRIGRFPDPKWIAGFIVGGAMLFVINLPRIVPSLLNTSFYQLILGNDIDIAIMGTAGIISIVPCVPRLKGHRSKFLAITFLVVSLLRCSFLPAACSYFNRNELTNLSGRIDSDGVYLQTTGYTCGPAATATVLNAYGIKDTERNIALNTGCNSYSGTKSLDLVDYINTRYGNKLRAEYRYFKDIDSLINTDAFFIAEVEAGAFTDHFVAILGLDNNSVMIADPSVGQIQTSIKLFTREWKNRAIVISPIIN